MTTSARMRSIAITCLSLAAAAGAARAYPIDGAERTGIQRLRGNANMQESPVHRKLPAGATLTTDEVELTLAGTKGERWDLGAKDPALQAALDSIFASRDPSYGVAVIDMSDPENIAWAGRNETMTQYPGSVGKVLCLTALFDGLRRAFPEPAERERVLRETIVVADAWSAGDSHKVPVFNPETGFSKWRAIEVGDRFTLSEWVDHMISASANSAGSTVWKEAMLLRHFGKEYPVSQERADAFLRDTPKGQLAKLAQDIITEPLKAADIDTSQLRQGTFWTRGGQARVPGISSFGSPRELARFLLRMEQGRLVDAWSSREMKRYLYVTKKRYRYIYAPELNDAATYFKSGSLYSCRGSSSPGPCKKFHGTSKNFMNSIAIIESPARPVEGVATKKYVATMLSNVLGVNSAWDHARVGAAIEEAVRTRSRTTVKEEGSAAAKADVGKSEDAPGTPGGTTVETGGGADD